MKGGKTKLGLQQSVTLSHSVAVWIKQHNVLTRFISFTDKGMTKLMVIRHGPLPV